MKDKCTKFTCLVIFTQHLRKIRTQIYLQDSLIYICKFCYASYDNHTALARENDKSCEIL